MITNIRLKENPKLNGITDMTKEEKKQRISEYKKLYYQKNKKRINERRKGYAKEYAKKYYKKNKDKINEYQREYSKLDKRKEYLKDYCRRKYVKDKKKEWYVQNKDEVLKRQKIYNDINKDIKKNYSKEWRKKNKDTIHSYSVSYYKKNKKKCDAYCKKYQKTERYKIIQANNIHRRRAAAKNSDVTTKYSEELRLKTTHCEICGKKFKTNDVKHLDHIIPINIGGTHTRLNVRYVHAKCNLQRPKNGSDIIQFKLAM